MAEGAKWVGTDGGGAEEGAGGGPVFCVAYNFLPLRTISYFTYEMVNKQSETARIAVSGSAGQDVRCFRLVRLDTIYPFH